jgi:NAD(P) transhydrogenase
MTLLLSSIETAGSDLFDLVVIGGGAAGEKGATQAAYHGYRVAVVERRAEPGRLSGVPVKALRDTAVYLTGWAQRDIYGVGISLAPDLVMNRLRARVTEVVHTTTAAARQNLERHGVELVHGEARLGPGRSVTVRDADADANERVLRARAILLATGSRPFHPPGIPFDDPDVHDSDTILSVERLPQRIVIVGGGPVGAEYASICSALGVEVTLVDLGTRILPFLDRELSEALSESLRRSGARLILGEAVESIGRDTQGLVVRVAGEELRPEIVLHAAGRTGNVERLALADAGVELDERGHITVGENF